MRSWLNPEEFRAVAEQNIARAIRSGEFLSLCCITASSASPTIAARFLDSIVSLLLNSLRASDTIGRLTATEVGVLLPETRRLDAFDVLLAFGRLAEGEAILDDEVATHVGIAEVDPAYPPPSVGSLLDVARLDLQIPAVRWSGAPSHWSPRAPNG